MILVLYALLFSVVCVCFFFLFKQKTAYEWRSSDCSSDVCSSDLAAPGARDAASIDVAITGCKFLKALEIFVQPAAILNPVVILLKNCIPTKPLSTAPIVVLRSTPVP